MSATGDANGTAQSDLSRAFVDASVLMAASLSASGSARVLFTTDVREHVVLYVSPLVLQETERNLYRKAPQGLGMFRELATRLADTVVHPPSDFVERVGQHIELKDAPIVAGTRTAGAAFLVTYDRRHLLSHAEVIHRLYGVAVVTPDILLVHVGDA
jgi:predicted nucleic acid-binding protein